MKSQRALPTSGANKVSLINTALPYLIAQAVGGGAAGCGDHLDCKAAERQDLAVIQQQIKIAAVGVESVRKTKHRFEMLLHCGDAAANPHLRAEWVAKERGGAEVIGVGVGFQHVAKR